MKEEERKKASEFLLGLETIIKLLQESIGEQKISDKSYTTKQGFKETPFDECKLKEEWKKLKEEFKGNEEIVEEFVMQHSTRYLGSFMKTNCVSISTKQSKAKIAQELRRRLREFQGIQKPTNPLFNGMKLKQS